MKRKHFLLLLFLFSLISVSAQNDLEINISIKATGADTKTHHEYVDLGLSVKWATCNIGAEKPKDFGDFFAWGETKRKSEYTKETYKFWGGYRGNYPQVTKYNTDRYFGRVDNKRFLESEDDAAQVLWGGDWRIPTPKDFEELIKYCTWTPGSVDDIYGYLIKSNVPGYIGRAIFLPAGGFRAEERTGSNVWGYYWTNMLDKMDCSSANTFIFSVSESIFGELEGTYSIKFRGSEIYIPGNRQTGRSIRPVCP